ncbi:MAG: SDR family NAD(P)-dependent oxidoreductase [Thermoplasmata archaeon]
MRSSPGRKAPVVPGDAGKESDVRRVLKVASERLGAIDFLVNHAGGARGADTDDPIDIADYKGGNRLLASNLGSTFLCARHVAPEMVKRKSGRIVNISSISEITGDCGPAYCAAKAGVLGLTRHSAVALAPYVQLNAILPGFVDSAPHDPEKAGHITPGRKMGHPEEIADLVGYLIATPQTFFTGTSIVMDGSVTNGIVGRMMNWEYAAGPDERAKTAG